MQNYYLRKLIMVLDKRAPPLFIMKQKSDELQRTRFAFLARVLLRLMRAKQGEHRHAIKNLEKGHITAKKKLHQV